MGTLAFNLIIFIWGPDREYGYSQSKRGKNAKNRSKTAIFNRKIDLKMKKPGEDPGLFAFLSQSKLEFRSFVLERDQAFHVSDVRSDARIRQSFRHKSDQLTLWSILLALTLYWFPSTLAFTDQLSRLAHSSFFFDGRLPVTAASFVDDLVV